MKKASIFNYLSTLVLGLSLLAGGCVSDVDKELDPASAKGYLTLDLAISGTVTRGNTDSPGEDKDLNNNPLNENTFKTVDLFFYKADATDETSAILHLHEKLSNVSSDAKQIQIPVTTLSELVEHESTTFSVKVIAVANWPETKTGEESSLPSLNTLKAIVTQDDAGTSNPTRAFRADKAPESFVMTNFDQVFAQNESDRPIVTIDESEGGKGTLSFKRVAAKIRLALSIEKTLEEDGVTWTADVDNMRLYISNGVRTARLDGDVEKHTLADASDENPLGDYFNITTSGSKDENSDFLFSRPLTHHDSNNLTGTPDNTYLYYNDLPYYTYPNQWTESMTETHQTMLTIVVPWKSKKSDDGEEIESYEPTYYSVPVSTNGKIVSNAYYYIRTHIGMKGSTTPEVPMKVEVESEIADWGTAETTEVELRPIRYLILNQTDFTVNNETSYTVPFMSTHPCEIIDCKLWVYGVNNDYGYENAIEIDDQTTYGPGSESSVTPTYKAKGKLYDYRINSSNNTFTFTHYMFNGLFNLKVSASAGDKRQNLFYDGIADRGNDKTRDELYNEKKTDDNHGTYTHKKHVAEGTKKLYARFEVEITLKHKDQPADTPYQEIVILRFFPNIYLSSEKIDESGGISDHDGWILVNGYGISDTNTGDLKNVSAAQGNERDSRALLTFTVTVLNEDDKSDRGWVIDDPRTLYINNELSDKSMQTDIADNTTRWQTSNHGGPYDGTQRSGGSSGDRHQKGSGLQTMWNYFEGPEDWKINWSRGTWNAREDIWSDDEENPQQYHRTLSYYYPAHEAQEKGNIIAPKFTIVSYHAYAANGSLSKQTARRRCAAYQQWGYPAGRWRLPSFAEIQFIKELQKTDVILDVFGGSDNWSAQGRVNANGVLSTTDNTAYTRCVYDNWYWEQVDANGTSYNKIPDSDGSHSNWKKFHWGDRPKENPLLNNSADAPTVENFLRKMNAKK